MNILAWLAGLVIGGTVAWQVARGYAATDLSRLRARLEEQIGYWQGEAERATLRATQLSEQTAAWVAGCQQGREDTLSVARALAQRTTGMGSPPGPA
jgi:predicted neuraminidase